MSFHFHNNLSLPFSSFNFWHTKVFTLLYHYSHWGSMILKKTTPRSNLSSEQSMILFINWLWLVFVCRSDTKTLFSLCCLRSRVSSIVISTKFSITFCRFVNACYLSRRNRSTMKDSCTDNVHPPPLHAVRSSEPKRYGSLLEHFRFVRRELKIFFAMCQLQRNLYIHRCCLL